MTVIKMDSGGLPQDFKDKIKDLTNQPEKVKLMRGEEKITDVDAEPTWAIYDELINAMDKDNMLMYKEKEELLFRPGLNSDDKKDDSVIDSWRIDILTKRFNKFTLGELQKKYPNVLKWFRKYNPHWIEMLEEKAKESSIADGQAKAKTKVQELLSALFKGKFISTIEFTNFKTLIEKDPTTTQKVLVSKIPDDFDTLYRSYPALLTFLKELDNTRFESLKAGYFAGK